jgi:hypothetical protein
LRHRNHTKNKARTKSPEAAPPIVNRAPLETIMCSLCAKPVRDFYNAVTSRITGLPSHFDCIMNELANSEQPKEGERICYLGGGVFGVVRDPRPGEAGPVVIIKKIPYELKSQEQPWRRYMSLQIQ